MASADAGRAKICTIYKNGDDRFTGKRFVINKRKVKTLDALLQNVTVECKARNAVRHLATPIGGTRIRNLEDIQDQANLVAVGPGPFRKIGYTEIANSQIPPRPSPRHNVMDSNDNHLVEIRPVHHSKRYEVFSGKARKIPTGSLTIFVYANGREFESSHRLTFTHTQLAKMGWFQLLDHVTDKVNLLTGACRFIYKKPDEGDDPNQWEKITSLQQFDNSKHYVAVGAEGGGLRRLDYGQTRPSFHTSPKLNRRKITFDSPSSFSSKNSRKSRASDNSNGTNQSSATNDTHNRTYGLGGNKTRNAEKSPDNRNTRKQRRKEEDNYHAKPKQKPVRHTHTPVDYDKDEGGIYKAKGARRETSGAAEVEETQDTKVDLPIDQVEPEEVDEEIEHEEKRDENRSRSPSPLSPLTYRKSPEPIVMSAANSRTQSRAKSQQNRTPTPTQCTPTPQQRTPTPRQRTPTPRQRTATPKDRTPTPKQRTPTPDNKQQEEEAAAEVEEETQDNQEENHDNEQENLERKHSAATRIQKHYKGYRDRKVVEEMKEDRNRSNETEQTPANDAEPDENQPQTTDEPINDDQQNDQSENTNENEANQSQNKDENEADQSENKDDNKANHSENKDENNDDKSGDQKNESDDAARPKTADKQDDSAPQPAAADESEQNEEKQKS